MAHVQTPLALLAALALAGCATTHVTLDPVCGTGPTAGVCTGNLTVPESAAEQVRGAGRAAIEHLARPEVEAALQSFLDDRPGLLTRNPDWQGWTAAAAATSTRASLPGAALGTFDGPVAWVKSKNWFWLGPNNVAYEADPARGLPARVNRWRLGGRTEGSVAGTIVHESAHAAGLRHDGSPRDCGPPYVIGEIVAALADGREPDFERSCPAGPWEDE